MRFPSCHWKYGVRRTSSVHMGKDVDSPNTKGMGRETTQGFCISMLRPVPRAGLFRDKRHCHKIGRWPAESSGRTALNPSSRTKDRGATTQGEGAIRWADNNYRYLSSGICRCRGFNSTSQHHVRAIWNRRGFLGTNDGEYGVWGNSGLWYVSLRSFPVSSFGVVIGILN